MFKKFTEGLVFGGGFGVSFIALWYIAAYLIAPMFIGNQFTELSETKVFENKQLSENTNIQQKPDVPFHELEPEELIKQSSVIALAKYQQAPDGKYIAIITEILKKEPGTKIYYDVGDEYKHSSYYPEDRKYYGDSLVLFFVGSPAQMRLSMSYSGDRISGLSDLPVKLLRQQCKNDNA